MKISQRIFKNTLKFLALAVFAIGFSSCATELKTKVSGNLKRLSPLQTVAILPFETVEVGQFEIADLLRQSMYANLQSSNFTLMEPYLIDSLLEKKGWDYPERFPTVNPMEFAELLGADAVVLGRVDKIERSYWVLHSSIELAVSVQMIDTRSGEVLWKAEQREKDFEGLGKIPTGITAAVFAPIEYVTNKLNLHRLMTGMVSRLTAIIKSPSTAKESEVASIPEIVPATSEGVQELKKEQKIQEEWDSKADANQPAPVEIKPATVAATTPPEKNLTPARQQAVQLVSTYQPPITPPVQPAIVSEVRKPITPEHIPIQSKSLTPVKASVPPTLKLSSALIETKNPPLKVSPVKEPATEDSVKFAQRIEQHPTLYTVQVGAYKTKGFADKLTGTLAKKGYDVFVTLNNKQLYKVQVDKFASKEEALKLSHELSSREKIPSFITAYSPS
jgi:cell division protein FtsN